MGVFAALAQHTRHTPPKTTTQSTKNNEIAQEI
jgi:hypothetical protein